jgi:hypothetical protein
MGPLVGITHLILYFSNTNKQSTGHRVLRHIDGLNLYKSYVLCLCYHLVPDHAHLYQSIYHGGYPPR